MVFSPVQRYIVMSNYPPKALGKLQEWGIDPEIAQQCDWQYDGGNAFIYPSGNDSRNRVLFLNPNGSGKNIWDNNTKDKPMSILYNVENISSELVYIANGEKSTLAMLTAGIPNVVNTFGEGQKVREAVQQLKAKGVTSVIVIPDCDNAGRKAAAKWRIECLTQGIQITILDLKTYAINTLGKSKEDAKKADTRDLWLWLGKDKDKFKTALNELPTIQQSDLPTITKQQQRLTNYTDNKNLPPSFIADIENALGVAGAAVGSEGYTKDAIVCPMHSHEHDDTRPAARWNVETHHLRCFKPGENFKAKTVGEALGIRLADYYDNTSIIPKGITSLGSSPEGTPAVIVDEELPYIGSYAIYDAFNRADIGLAELFGELYQGRIVYDPTYKSYGWHIWAGHHWQQTSSSKIYLIMSHALGFQLECRLNELDAEIALLNAPITPTTKEEEEIKEKSDKLKDIRKLVDKAKEAVNYVTTLKHIAEAAQAVLEFDNTWDNVPERLPVANGVIDLRSGELVIGKPENYIRKYCPVLWTGKNTPAKRFEKFLQEIFEPTPEIADFIQLLFGYAISGTVREHILPVLYGADGRNGKDTLLETIRGVLGNDLASPASQDILISQGGRTAGSASPHIVDLQGKRLAWVSETARGARLNENQVKYITGGGTLNARPLYGNPVNFEQSHTVMLITNHKPEVSTGGDAALWARLILIPFSMRFIDNPQRENERQAEKGLTGKLKEEKSGILAWLVAGYQEYLKLEGLQPPKSVQAATEEYQGEENEFERFLDDCCYLSANVSIQSTPLYDAYQDWGGSLKKRDFAKQLKAIFGEAQKGAQGKRYYHGVALRTDETEPT